MASPDKLHHFGFPLPPVHHSSTQRPPIQRPPTRRPPTQHPPTQHLPTQQPTVKRANSFSTLPRSPLRSATASSFSLVRERKNASPPIVMRPKTSHSSNRALTPTPTFSLLPMSSPTTSVNGHALGKISAFPGSLQKVINELHAWSEVIEKNKQGLNNKIRDIIDTKKKRQSEKGSQSPEKNKSPKRFFLKVGRSDHKTRLDQLSNELNLSKIKIECEIKKGTIIDRLAGVLELLRDDKPSQNPDDPVGIEEAARIIIHIYELKLVFEIIDTYIKRRAKHLQENSCEDEYWEETQLIQSTSASIQTKIHSVDGLISKLETESRGDDVIIQISKFLEGPNDVTPSKKRAHEDWFNKTVLPVRDEFKKRTCSLY
ncbi:hypothetical protein PNOK_0761700 [Pyrrhoderma noxium]|uniref:Uncharacterized protein n=1 Tax=Pyrrhoderma noxium TaxID=2282107 RepID=A0A286UD58_9AGAM|nr:hypothetical protein PNOK_0761700 [Pyrrhoderma noxium]